MPLYEFVLRAPGRAEETRISDHDSVGEGEVVMIDHGRWLVVGVEVPTGERADHVAVQARIILTPERPT